MTWRPLPERIAQLTRYGSVSVWATAVDWVVFAALLHLTGRLLVSQGISRLTGAVVAFVLHKWWAFDAGDTGQGPAEARRFVTVVALSYGLSLASLYVLTALSGSPWLGKLGADGLCFAFNFVMLRAWVFRRPEVAQASASPRS